MTADSDRAAVAGSGARLVTADSDRAAVAGSGARPVTADSDRAPVAGSRARLVAEQVPDPELPMVTLADLGILRDVREDGDTVTVTLTPTYSGCPAMREISQSLTRVLQEAGFPAVVLRTELFPPWSSGWITAAGRAKLAAAGISPPQATAPRPAGPVPLTLTAPGSALACPRCGSPDTRLTSAFGATACRSLHRCAGCGEPFEHIKEL